MIQNCQVVADNKISNSRQNFCKLLANVIQETLASLIQRRLKELDIKKAELARRTGLSRTYITDLANKTGNTQSGTYNLPPETVSKLAKGLEVSSSVVSAALGYELSDTNGGLYRGLDQVPPGKRRLVEKQIDAIIKAAIEDEPDFDYGVD